MTPNSRLSNTLIQLLEEKLRCISKAIEAACHSCNRRVLIYNLCNKWKDCLFVFIIYHNIKENLTVVYIRITCHRANHSCKWLKIYNFVVPVTAMIATGKMQHDKSLISGSEKGLNFWNLHLLNAWMNPVGRFQTPKAELYLSCTKRTVMFPRKCHQISTYQW